MTDPLVDIHVHLRYTDDRPWVTIARAVVNPDQPDPDQLQRLAQAFKNALAPAPGKDQQQ